MAAKYSCLRSDVARRLLILFGWSLRSYAASSLQLLLSIGNDLVAPLQSRRDYHGAALGQGDLYRTHLHGIVGVHNVAIRTIGSAQDRAGGCGNSVLARLQQQMNVDKLVRPQTVIRIVEDSLQLGCACGLVNLVADGQQLPRSQLRLIVAAVRVNF